ncbi:hypothetical protein M0R45_023684 [Rubus argutus]|uniref:Uncharacterized protein n=1 Tax=Rubus argutus TaxID=59490 RepID=A0AAW1WPB9_RUBAR
MEEAGNGKRNSSSPVSSRLSAKAEPFTLNRFAAQPTWTSSLTSVDPCDSLLKSLSSINLEGDPLSSSVSNFGLDSSFGHHKASLACTNYASSAYETSLEQGKPVKKSKLYENSESIHDKCSDFTMGRENPFISRSTDQVDAGIFSFSAVNFVATPCEFSKSDMCSAAMSQSYSQTQLPYTAPAASWSHCNSTIAFGESGLKKYDSCTVKSTVSHSLKDNALQDMGEDNALQDMGLDSSNTSTTFWPSSSILSKNAECTSNFAVKYNDISSKYSPPGIVDLHDLLYGEGNEIGHDKSASDKGNERKGGKPMSSEGSDPLLTDKSNPQVSLKKLHDEFSSEHLDAEAAVSLSTKFDENDFDVDSPCWRGTQASRQSPFVSRSSSSHSVENVQEASYSLNPLAPQFFPRPSKAIVNCYANECVADDFSFFQKSESPAVSAVSPFSKGKMPGDKARSKSSLSINGTEIQTSNDIHESKREYALLNNSGSGEGASKLLSTRSGMDSTILNLMHDLSELLVQNCSNDVDLLNEHDLIQHIINNLCMYIQRRAGGKTPMPDFTLAGIPCYPNKPTELVKCSNMGFQVTKTGAFSFQHKLANQNGREGRKVDCQDYAERMLDSFPSFSDIGTEKSKGIIQIMGNALRDNHSTKEELDPQALVYKQLWLEAEAALRSVKYERCVMREIGYELAQSKQK